MQFTSMCSQVYPLPRPRLTWRPSQSLSWLWLRIRAAIVTQNGICQLLNLHCICRGIGLATIWLWSASDGETSPNTVAPGDESPNGDSFSKFRLLCRPQSFAVALSPGRTRQIMWIHRWLLERLHASTRDGDIDREVERTSQALQSVCRFAFWVHPRTI